MSAEAPAAAIEATHYSRSAVAAGTVMVSGAAEEDVVGEAAAVSSDLAQAGEFVSSARRVLGVVEEVRDLDALVPATPMRFQGLALSVAIQLVVEGRVEGPAARGHCAVPALIAPAALLRRLLARPQGSRTRWISIAMLVS